MHDDVEFADFVHATGTQLFRTALLLCGDHHLAEDLTQTTYAKVFAKWPKVRRADSPAAYARTMLLNTFLSHRRLRRSSERPADDLPEGRYDDRDPSERLDLLRALGMSVGAVRTRSSRALAKLRARLEPDLVPAAAPQPGKEHAR